MLLTRKKAKTPPKFLTSKQYPRQEIPNFFMFSFSSTFEINFPVKFVVNLT